MNQKRLADFDALIGGYYGKSGATDVETDPRKRVQDLLSSYYGKPGGSARARAQQPSISLSLGCDDGEILSQPPQSAPTGRQNGDGRQNAPAVSLDFEEYVIDVSEADSPSEAGTAAPPPTPAAAKQPAIQTPPAPAPAGGAAPPIPPPTAPTPAASPVTSGQSLTPDQADIVSDIQSIISGQKLYEKDRGLVDRSTATSTDSSARNTPYAGVSNQPKDGHEIFDRIAQSMKYANAYDFGNVPLENRFAEFDRQEDQRRRGSQKQTAATPTSTAQSQPARRPQPAAIDYVRPTTADFVADLDAIKSRSDTAKYTRPFYDTGEHVLAGNGLYADRLRVGKDQSVRMSYGQIISMGDLYATPKDLMDADPAELNRLKTLILRSTAFYEGKKSNKGMDVSNDEWDKATGGTDAAQGRYLKLAEDNYEHFSPPMVAMGSGLRTSHGDNRSEWERYHRQAIEEAQAEGLAQPNGVDIFFEKALIINAFADHFLTDAFAAGHLINKEVMIDRFKAAFLNGSDLTSAADTFFDRVAKVAWKGDVATRFSKLETYDHPDVSVGPLDVPLPWHPNIDSAEMLARVLKGAATQEPDRVGNLVVKALHDYLNTNGVEVTNDAGDGAWILPGDGTLTVGTGRLTQANLAKNLKIMRKAVQQSIDDINSPSIRASNLDFQKYFDGVWRYVPILTSASQKQVTALIADYTNPGSSSLVNAAAAIVKDQLDSFIKLLLQEHKLRPA